jgi:HpaII restriction endonuclease
MITGNKGEWSEIYTLFKLLSDKNLFVGDSKLNKVEDVFYPIIKILRAESGGDFEYSLDGEMVVISGDAEPLRVPVETFTTQAALLLGKIRESNGAFSIPEVEAFLVSLRCKSLKAKSTSKTDIVLVIHDKYINQSAQLGFSIKSQLGGEATLLNAGKTTNFIFSIDDLTLSDTQIEEINSIDSKSKIKDRVETIKQAGGVLRFERLENGMFFNNLVLIDSLLPSILAEILYAFFTTSLSSIQDLVKHTSEQNLINYDVQYEHKFYDYKIKRFLTDIALGMTPATVWSGLYDATGGYLVVKDSGEVLCYHIYQKNQFEEYLFCNTKLETASSSRHDFGKVYKENNRLFLKLNLQIRFK